MTDQLRLEIELDPDGTAELYATVQLGPFSGHSSAWFNQDELVRFGQSIAQAFPLVGSVGLSGGFWSDTSPGELIEEHVAINFYAIGNCGKIGCHIRLASLQFNSERPESRRAVQAELEVTYAELQRFGPALVELAMGRASEAVLQATAA